MEYCNKIINDSIIIDKTLDIKITGTITTAKKRFATTFIQGEFPHRYEELFDFNNSEHKYWWYEGLTIYKNNNLNYCPWCKSNYVNFDVNIKQQVENIESVSTIDNKLFSDKTNKVNSLREIKESFELDQIVIEKIDSVIELINASIDNNNEQLIIDEMKQLEGYRALLNSITNIDDDEVSWPTLCLNDFKAIPKVVINQIINIIK